MRTLNRIVDLVYPPACLLCHAFLPPTLLAQPEHSSSRPIFCGDCASQIDWSGRPVCFRCGLGLPGAFDAIVECPRCRIAPPAFLMARTPWRYAGTTQEAIQQFKYRRHWRIGTWLAEEMAATAQVAFPLAHVDLVLPVPWHWLKRHVRGVNPVEQLAQTIAHTLEKPYAPQALRRTRWTTTQTALSLRRRFSNVLGAFTARPPIVAKRSVLLIDDVLTSGATAHACALALRSAGACDVFVLAAARTPLE